MFVVETECTFWNSLKLSLDCKDGDIITVRSVVQIIAKTSVEYYMGKLKNGFSYKID